MKNTLFGSGKTHFRAFFFPTKKGIVAWQPPAGHYLAYLASFYRRRDKEAVQFLETALEYSCYTTFAAQEVIMTEAAIFQARRARQIGLAEQSLNDLPQKTQIPGL